MPHDHVKDTLTERCMYARPYSRGRYCVYEGPCAFRGTWLILAGAEQQKCGKQPFQFSDWSAVGLYVWPPGTATIEKLHDMRREISVMIGAGKKALVVDLTNVTELHVNLLETLADLRVELVAAHHDGAMIVISLDSHLRYAFETSPFSEGIRFVL